LRAAGFGDGEVAAAVREANGQVEGESFDDLL